ncbi:MAG: DinB family protein [Bacteroidota bacterium]|jgi:uncharacterized damage-inducible protein DinB
MYRVLNDFFEDWKYESESTLKLFNNITDESKNQKVTQEGRSLGFIAWHITQSIPEMMQRTGLDFAGFDEYLPEPNSFSGIVSRYKKYSDELFSQLEKKWSDIDLNENINMYGENWKKGKVLSVLIIHQAHHRAQMTVLMRQAGLLVPGVYGPSREEWAAMKMDPQM